jgi:hypothetical protein
MSIRRTRDAPHPLDQIGQLAAPKMVVVGSLRPSAGDDPPVPSLTQN